MIYIALHSFVLLFDIFGQCNASRFEGLFSTFYKIRAKTGIILTTKLFSIALSYIFGHAV